MLDTISRDSLTAKTDNTRYAEILPTTTKNPDDSIRVLHVCDSVRNLIDPFYSRPAVVTSQRRARSLTIQNACAIIETAGV